MPSSKRSWIKMMVHVKAAQFGELLMIRKYRARLRLFGSNGVTTTFHEVICGATAARPDGRWYSLSHAVMHGDELRDSSAHHKMGHESNSLIYPDKTTTWIWNDHQYGGFAGRPASKNSVNCGNIRGSQTTRRMAVTMFGCGQSATKPFAATA